MLRDHVSDFYLNQDYNCAEAMLRCIDKAYGLGLTEEEFKLVSGFGGGMGCGKACGALCGGIGALGRILVKERAHATGGFKETCAKFAEAFEKRLGSTECETLAGIYKKEDVRCLKTVQLAADVFEELYEGLKGNL